MKSKLFRILGVATTVAMLAGMLTVAPALAVTTPTAVLTLQGTGVAYTISSPNIYTSTFTVGTLVPSLGKINVAFPATTNLANLTQAVVSTGGAFRLPDIGQSFTITDAAGGGSGTIVVTSGAVAVTFTGSGAWADPAWSTPAVAGTIVVTATAANTVGTWTLAAGVATAASTNKTGTAATSNAMIISIQGIGGGVITALTNCAYAVTGTYPAAQTLSITVPTTAPVGGIGAGALVQIVLGTTSGILNPSTAGSYTFTVATTTAVPATIEAAATSNAYTIIVPTLTPLPGIVNVYNSGGVLMVQKGGDGAILAALAAVPSIGYTLEVGPGVYVEAAALILTAGVHDNLTIKASGALADTIIPALWTVNAPGVTFKGLTLRGREAAGTDVTIGATGNTVLFDGCSFVRSGSAISTFVETFINYGNTTALGTGKVTNCTLDSTLAAVADTGILVSAGSIGLTVDKNTFKVDNTALGAQDIAINIAATCTVTNNTFTGASGIGIRVTGGGIAAAPVNINTNTFTNLDVALDVTGGTVSFKTNTADACGLAISTTLLVGSPVIRDTGAVGITVLNNVLKNSKAYVGDSTTGTGTWMFNDLTGSAKGFRCTAGVLNATHNWWGVATGPAAGANSAVFVDATYYLGSVSGNGTIAAGLSTLNASTTAGVVVDTAIAATGVAFPTTLIGVASYATNPASAAPASTLAVKKYFDLFVTGLTPGTHQISARFYGTITSSSEVWFWNGLTKSWAKCSIQGASTTGGYVFVTITGASNPSIIDTVGTVFVLVEAPPAAPAGAVIAQSPTLGAAGVPIDTTFTWGAVPGAVSYVFEIAEEIGQIDKFYLKDEVAGPAVNAYKLLDNLKYDTQYWWRVQAVNAVGTKSAWTVAFFTTAKEPVVVEVLPPVVIQQNPPSEITLEIPPSPSPVQPIPSYLLWAVIGVGAVLVIAVIVLIVRTRRIS